MIQTTAATSGKTSDSATPRKHPKRIPLHVQNQLAAFGNGTLPDEAEIGFQAFGILSGRSRTSLYRDIKEGLLHPIKRGHLVSFKASDARAYLKRGAQ